METETKTFEEKAAEYQYAVMDDMRDLLNRKGDYEDWDEEVSDRVRQWEMETLLDSQGVWKGRNKDEAELQHVMITLATGGPAYGLKITPTYSYDYDIEFWYQDWWKPKHYIILTEDEASLFAMLADSELELIDY